MCLALFHGWALAPLLATSKPNCERHGRNSRTCAGAWKRLGALPIAELQSLKAELEREITTQRTALDDGRAKGGDRVLARLQKKPSIGLFRRRFGLWVGYSSIM